MLERGERLARIDTAVKLAGALDIEVDDLFAGMDWAPGETRSGHRPSYPVAMSKRSKKPADLNRLAAAIVGDATDETTPEPEGKKAEAGRIGGLKGGVQRSKQLSAERRSEIARAAANARWRKA